jgi:hypothetical protein
VYRPLVFWSGYRRYVREAGRYWKIFVPRLRCARCGVSHALLPAFTLAWWAGCGRDHRLGGRGGGGWRGVRGPPGGGAGGVPYTTARGWVRRFRARAAELGVAFAAVELGGRTFVSILSASGVRIEDISDLVGHSGATVTESVYRHEIRPALTTGATAMNKILSEKRPRSEKGPRIKIRNPSDQQVLVGTAGFEPATP